MSSAAAAVAAQHDLKTAAEAFEAGFYLRAVSMLVSSESSSQPESRQYRHNLLISEYLSSKNPDPTLLMNSLATLDEASPDDVKGRAVLRYNRAILFVRCCQFVNALAILWPVYNARIETGLELGFSVKIALLLLQIFIRTWNISRAEAVLDDLVAMRQNLQATDANCLPNHRSFHASELSFYIHLFQTRISLLSRNEKTAKKTIKLAMQDLNKDCTSSVGSQHTQEISDYHKASALLVKARLESFSDKYTKSIKLLNNVKFACSKDPRVSIVYLNNLGCVHYAMKRYHAAAFYLHRALELQEFDRSDRNSPYCIRFNWYLQQLNAGNANVCSNLFANVGLFAGSYWHWLHLGRASVLSYYELCYKDFVCSRPSSVFFQVPRFRLSSSEDDSSEISSFLQRGYSCFQNAFILSPSTQLKQAALLGLSFVCLALSRFSECLHWLDQFEVLPSSDRSFSIISKVYRCEALCSLNRMHEAMQCLSQVAKSSDGASEEDLAAIFNSLTSLYCLSDKVEMALVYALKSHSSHPNDERSLRNMIYLLLRHRMFAEAQFVLFHRLPPPAIALPE